MGRPGDKAVPVWNKGRVLYQEAGDHGIPEPALLIHEDNGGCLIVQQEERYVTLNRESLPAFIAELKKELKPAEPEARP